MNMKRLMVLIINLGIIFSPIYASQEDSEPIVVRLAVDNPLKPVYLGSIIDDASDFTDSYLNQLENVMIFDFSNNGKTRVAKRKDDLDDLIISVPFDQFGALSEWKNQKIEYVIKSRMKGNTLFVNLLNVNGQSTRSAGTIPLSGNIAEDRREVHKLADAIFRSWFNSDGIASTKILYTLKTSSNGKMVSEVWEVDYDGSNVRQLTKGSNFCVTPCYLPPKPGLLSGGFVYVSYQIGQPKIYIASFKDLVGKRVSTLKANQFMPAISRQRDKIAFISDVTGNPDLFIQPFNPEKGAVDKPYQVFSAKKATQATPTFSPDGTRLAFVSDKDGPPRIYVIDVPAPGTNLKNVQPVLISKQNRENSAPSWSPDGTKIAFCARTKGDRQIWVYDLKTKKESQVTEGRGNKENPTWAPDSQHIVFNSTDKNNSNLYIMNLNQSEPVQISFGYGDKQFPSWESR